MTKIDFTFHRATYRVIEEISRNAKTVVYRAMQIDAVVAEEPRSVVIKLLSLEYPTERDLVEFRRQYTISKNLDLPGIVRPYSLEECDRGYALVMEDFGGISLRDRLQNVSQERRLVLVDILKIGIQLADTLHGLGQQQIVHKDIKPANILIHPDTDRVKLIDFSIASRLPRETPEILSHHLLEGTLAYISPEQTGRMNRGIDYRTDFYSLGVTLYELSTGKLPFESQDPIELIYCHLAQIAVPVHEISPQIPLVVSNIIAKLMSKNAEDRYQSALGLKYDLELCLHQWGTTGEITNFELGKRDLCDRFAIPEKLYGRESEIQTLLDAFNRVATGSSELILVTGASGIGKTAVIDEVHTPITRDRGYFIKGKFDRFDRDTHLNAFVRAGRDLICQLLSESDSQRSSWQQKILAAVGQNGQLLIDVIPELERIIGTQPAVTAVSGMVAQNRLNWLLKKFIAVFTQPKHPLTLCLDDLQWADLASIELIELLMADNGHLLVLGAYRDNEVSPSHPLMSMVAKLQQAQKIVNTITLSPLTFDDINRTIADTLHCSIAGAKSLAEIIERKTQGNPFFMTQFLKALHADGEIWFNANGGYWECDIMRVQELSITDDVIEFMAMQLQKLPIQTQSMLKLAACMGNSFDLETLAIVSERSQADTATALWQGLEAGLILPSSQIYKFFQSRPIRQVESDSSVNLSYRFVHDRVRQAAYSSIPEPERASQHARIGRLLLEQTADADIEDRIFMLLDRLNYGVPQLTDRAERDRLAELNCIGCRKAKAANADRIASEYARIALDLLGSDGWERQYALCLTLHELLAQIAARGGEYEQMEGYIATAIDRSRTALDRVGVYTIAIQAQTFRHRYVEAIEIGRSILQQLGVELPSEPQNADIYQSMESVTAALENSQCKSIADLFDLPPMTDIATMATIEIAANILPGCHIIDSPLHHLVSALVVKLSIQYGNNPASVASYAMYASGLLEFNRVDTAIEFGRLAVRTLWETDAARQNPETLLPLSLFIHHRHAHLRETLELLQLGERRCAQIGKVEYVGYYGYALCLHTYWCGRSLGEVAELARSYRNKLLALDRVTSANHCEIMAETALALMGNPVDDTATQQLLDRAEGNKLHLRLVYLHRAIYRFLTGDIAGANDDIVRYAAYENSTTGTIAKVGFYLYDSLIALAQISTIVADLDSHAPNVSANQLQLAQWAEYAPMNYLHKWQLVEAEKCRVLGIKTDAIELYDLAIAGAKANRYLQEEALANELTAKFYLAWGKEKVAAAYMQEAYYGYLKWGATAKIDDLERRYAPLLAPILKQARHEFNSLSTFTTLSSSFGSIGTSERTVDTLDLVSVLQSAQALSSTLELTELIHQLSQIILKNSGAQTCLVALPDDDDKWQIRSIATVGSAPSSETLLPSLLTDGSLEYPTGSIYWIKNTKQTIICDARQPLEFDDRYLRTHQPQSVFALPIVKQDKVVGVVYLEHRQAPDIFAETHRTAISFLCTQAAIALENARLYQAARDAIENTRIQQSYLEALLNNIPHLAWLKDEASRFIAANQSFGKIVDFHPIELIGKIDLDVWPLDLADKYRRDDLQVMASGKRQILEEKIRNPQGQERWLETIKTPIRDEDGKITGTVGIALDITDRKIAERELKLTHFAIDNSALGTAWIRPDGTFSYGNPAICQMLGYTFDEFCALSVWDIHHPEVVAQQTWLAHWQQLKANGALSIESEHHGKDGTYYPVELSLSYIEFEGEEHIFVQARNITHRKIMEVALRTSEARYHQMVSNIPAVLYQIELLADGSYQLNYTSARFPELLELTAPAAISDISVLFELVVPEDRESFARSLPNTAQPWLWEGRVCTPTGKIKWIRGQSRPFETSDGRLVWDGMLTDITEQQAALHERQQAQIELSLTNERLESTIQEVKRATRLKDEFLATMSHELRTPLNAILGMSEALQEQVFGNLNPRQIQSLQTIERSGKHLLSVINDILDVSKISAGKLDLNIATVDLAHLCHSSLAFIKQQALQKQLQLDFQLPSVPGNIAVDERRMRQVLINLLGNAVKFTPPGGRIFLQVTRQQHAGEDSVWLEFAISDTGIGIATADLDRLFHPFVQLDSSLNRQYEGTGLGLALVKQIVELHGGKISVSSELDRGSCFTIRLPDTHASAPENDTLAPFDTLTDYNSPIDRGTIEPALILLAEDNRANINTLTSYLKAKGYRLLVAENGRQAISILEGCATELVEPERPDLILMDIQMPEMDGLEAIAWIRQQLKLTEIPIIALTALAMAEDREKCLAAGANEYLTKPVKLKQLSTMIQQLIRG